MYCAAIAVHEPGEETVYQCDMLVSLSAHSLGYFGTSPDGNCLFNAISQCTSQLNPAQIADHPQHGQHRQAEYRQIAGDVMCSDQTFQQVMRKNVDDILYNNRDIRKQHAAHPEVLIWQQLATLTRKNKQWVGIWAIKALAIALQLDIVVFGLVSTLFYSKSSITDNRYRGKDCPYINYPRGSGTRRNPIRDLPLEALSPATCFVVYHGSGHFWQLYKQEHCQPKNHLRLETSVLKCPTLDSWCISQLLCRPTL